METQGRKYSSYSFMTLALNGVNGQSHARLRFTPGKKPVPIVQGAGWARADLDTEVKGKILLPLLRIESRSPDGPVRSQTLY
jgi:hypothetical protein